MEGSDYQRLFETAPALSVVLDRGLRIAAASDAFLRATMTQRERIVGRELLEVFPGSPENGAGVALVRGLLERVLHEGTEQRLALQRWDAVFFPLPGPHGEVRHIACVVEDVTARKAGERAQRESDERYRKLFESIDAGFCIIEMLYDAAGRPHDYRFLEVNPAFERQTGLAQPTRKTMREHVPDHEQHWFDIYARVAETGEPVRFVEQARPLMGGWYEVYAYRVGAAGSRRVGVLFNDVTERMRAEQALREAARRKDEFLATLAHELRNPLAPIRNAVSMLQLREGADAELRRARDLIDRQLRHLVRLVDDLLDVSRITFGKVRLQRARVDLREVAGEALAASEPLLAASSHRVSLELPEAAVWVDADRMRLAQVISNLLDNAARYTPAGGAIALEAGAADGDAFVAVRDNGVGIEPELIERVFEPFMQVERHDGAGPGGIGIGLSLAKALVELHGGRIRAESAGPGRGSRFLVSLPRAAAPEAALPLPAAERSSARRLLIVDDNIDAAASQAALLRMLGHEVETAYSGPAALEKVQRFRPEIVLLDLGMPGMDGYEVARRLRASPQGRRLVLVAQTGWSQEEDRRRSREAGFDAHLAKPVDVHKLAQLF